MKAAAVLFFCAVACGAVAQEPFAVPPPLPALQAQSRAWTAAVLAHQKAPVALPTARTTSGPAQRLRTISTAEGASVYETRFFWKSGTRMALHDPKNLYSYNGYYTPFAFGPYSSRYVAASSRIQYIPADSVFFSRNGVPSASIGYQYNSDNKLVHQNSYTPEGQLTASTALTYDGAGNNTRCLDALTDNFYSYRDQYSRYDAANRPVQDSIVSSEHWHDRDTTRVELFRRRYNAAGQLSAIQWLYLGEDTVQLSLYYNSDGLLASTVEEFAGPSFRKLISKDSVIYAGANPAYTGLYQISSIPNSTYTGDTLVVMYKEQNELNAAGNWRTMVRTSYKVDSNIWYDSTRSELTYNSANNPETRTDYYAYHGALPATPTRITNYYYQTYDPTTGVWTPAAEPDVVATFQIVPNPARGSFQIRRPYGGNADYSITDATGRTVLRGAFQAAVGTVRVPSHLPQGLYFVTVRTDGAAPQVVRLLLQ